MTELVADRAVVDLLQWQPARRKFLVCVRAGRHSLHLDWFDPEQPRRWDLMLNYHAVPDEGPDFRAEMVTVGGISKFTAIRELLHGHPDAFDDYHAVCFLDDDVALSFDQLDKLFWLFSRYGLHLGQAALDHQSVASWPVTLQCPAFRVRFTNFVEIMMPIFSRAALRRCVLTFDASVSGHGLDFVWAAMLGDEVNRIGIIDDIAVHHSLPTDPAGGTPYRATRSLGGSAQREMGQVLRRFDLGDPNPQVSGAILRLLDAPDGGWSSYRSLLPGG